VILQRTPTTAQVLLRAAKTVGRNQLIGSGMPPCEWSADLTPGVDGQHAQLVKAENLF
jgi:hypothetical protein